MKQFFILTLALGMFSLAISQPYMGDEQDTDTSSFHWGV